LEHFRRAVTTPILQCATAALLLAAVVSAQYRPPVLGPGQSTAATAPVPHAAAKTAPPRANAPGANEILIKARVQDSEGSVLHLRGTPAEIETLEWLMKADQFDYDQDAKIVEARGHVYFKSFESGEEIRCDRLDYDMNKETGTFYKVTGSIPGKIDTRPGILTTGNPFLFQGDWAERIEGRYLLHDGVLTNCTFPNPWWSLKAPVFDIIPGERALAYKSVMRMRRVPILYAPLFYKSLEAQPRRSGFLTPNIGTSSQRGYMFGLGYYWAINRSYDLQYRAQIFTARGLAHTGDFRGKPTRNSDFNVYVYGVDDKGLKQSDGTRSQPEGGFLVNVTGKAELKDGFYARGVVNYLSSFLFRQSFTESFNEAVFSEVNSIAYVSKDWSSYHLNFVFARQQNFMSATPGDDIVIRKLPQVEFNSRDRLISSKILPIYVSWDADMAALRRTQPLFQTRQFVPRLDAEPRLTTAIHLKDVHIVPTFSVRETFYGSTFQVPGNPAAPEVTGGNLLRSTGEVNVDLILPALERTYDAPRWLGTKVKHVIEPRGTYRRVVGSFDFDKLIRFDEAEIVSGTNEAEVMLINRFFVKNRAGAVNEVLSWELSQRRFFDPTMGGAVATGERNVFQSSAQMTGYAFFDQPRNYSPVVSLVRASLWPKIGLELRNDYDPLRSRLVNSSLSADLRWSDYFLSLGHNKVSCVPLYSPTAAPPSQSPCAGPVPPEGTVLSPPSNQFRGMLGFGNENKRGWNVGFLAIYDYRVDTLQYANTQVTYNTSCCAYSMQYRRFNFGTRFENQYRFAFVIANFGSFGTLKRQERLF
jgi:LPS-assembly protein